jgi:hypothetical protein
MYPNLVNWFENMPAGNPGHSDGSLHSNRYERNWKVLLAFFQEILAKLKIVCSIEREENEMKKKENKFLRCWLRSMVTRCVCAKNRPKCIPSRFISKLNHNFYKSKQSPNKRKFAQSGRPARSHQRIKVHLRKIWPKPTFVRGNAKFLFGSITYICKIIQYGPSEIPRRCWICQNTNN